MNLKLIFNDHIDSWDTRADGSAATSYATLRVRSGRIELLEVLNFEDEYNEEGYATEEASRAERSLIYPVLTLEGKHGALSFPDFFNLANQQLGLLRFDVDGETIYQAQPEEGEE